MRTRTAALLLAVLSFWLLLVTFIHFYFSREMSSSSLRPASSSNSGDNTPGVDYSGNGYGSGGAREITQGAKNGGHKLCIIIPFRYCPYFPPTLFSLLIKPFFCRDREDELARFLPYMDKFLADQRVPYSVYVVNQTDALRFNRASLINAGFLHVREKDPSCDYLALHDVDLLPANRNLSYSFPAQGGPRHLSPPGLHPKYDYPNFLGGILLIQAAHFELVDGMTNNCWGWGLEDDEFLRRIWEANLTISRPEGISSGKDDTFRHLHSPKVRQRDYQMCYNQRDLTRRRDRVTGLSTLKHRLSPDSPKRLAENAFVLDVELECDLSKTPWCDCSGAPATEAPLRPIEPGENIMPRFPNRKRRKKKQQ